MWRRNSECQTVFKENLYIYASNVLIAVIHRWVCSALGALLDVLGHELKTKVLFWNFLSGV